MKDTALSVQIVKGEVAAYAKLVAQNEKVSKNKTAEILREIADLIEQDLTPATPDVTTE